MMPLAWNLDGRSETGSKVQVVGNAWFLRDLSKTTTRILATSCYRLSSIMTETKEVYLGSGSLARNGEIEDHDG